MAVSTASSRMRIAVGVAILVGSTAACQGAGPPTVTPPAETATLAGVTSIEIPVNPPPGATLAPAPGDLPLGNLSAVVGYRDPDGRFSMDIPAGWVETRQPPAQPGSSVVLGTVFQPPEGNALITITQFDSGRRPSAVGSTANEVLQMSGVMDRPGYVELGREQVIERPNEALRVEIAYTRGDGTPMHSLVLFQIDSTVFSMVHMGVVEDGWRDTEGAIRDALASYRVPALSDG